RLATSMIAETRVRIATRSDGRHVSLRQLAHAAGCSHMTVSRYIHGAPPAAVVQWFMLSAASKLLQADTSNSTGL
ncbi:hypothetical protein LCGC14_1541770, partial [marine sediment metagenome]